MTNSVSASESKLLARSPIVNGRAQIDVAKITVVSRSSANSMHANQRAGFHRGDGRRPFGNRRNRNGSIPTGIDPVAFAIHPAMRPPGREPGSATRAWSA